MKQISELREYSLAETAKAVKAVLREAYPGTKWSVRSHSYSGGSAIRVRWIDGPTSKDVRDMIDVFGSATFDGMIDLKSYITRGRTWKGQRVRFHGDWVSCSRSVSAGNLNEVGRAYAKTTGVRVPRAVPSNFDKRAGTFLEQGPLVDMVPYVPHMRHGISLDDVPSAVIHDGSRLMTAGYVVNDLADATRFETAQPVDLPQWVDEAEEVTVETAMFNMAHRSANRA